MAKTRETFYRRGKYSSVNWYSIKNEGAYNEEREGYYEGSLGIVRIVQSYFEPRNEVYVDLSASLEGYSLSVGYDTRFSNHGYQMICGQLLKKLQKMVVEAKKRRK